jgi:hypothetical protein
MQQLADFSSSAAERPTALAPRFSILLKHAQAALVAAQFYRAREDSCNPAGEAAAWPPSFMRRNEGTNI